MQKMKEMKLKDDDQKQITNFSYLIKKQVVFDCGGKL